ncbi:MAG: adenylyltransferase/cytidyltransferase family protein [Chloroflexota bacterium]
MKKKIVTLEELLSIRRGLRQEGRTLVFTNGLFDLVHAGHIRYLQQARELGDVLAIGLNSDSSASELKGPKRPILPEAERAEVLAAMESVDYIVPFSDRTAERLVATLKPDVYVKGGDYSTEGGDAGKPLPEAEIVASYGGRTVILPLVPGCSTTGILERILERYAKPS